MPLTKSRTRQKRASSLVVHRAWSHRHRGGWSDGRESRCGACLRQIIETGRDQLAFEDFGGALYRFGKTLNDVSVQKHFDKEEGRRA